MDAHRRQDVLVLESHDRPGGITLSCALHVLDALGESIPCANYDSWMVYLTEGEFLSRIGPTVFLKDLEKYATPNADAVLHLSTAAMALPPLSIHVDWGVLSNAAGTYASSLLKSFIQMGPQGALGATKLLRPFSKIVDSLQLKDHFIRNWVDLLAFLLVVVKSNGILSAKMIYMFAEWYKPGCSLETRFMELGQLLMPLFGE